MHTLSNVRESVSPEIGTFLHHEEGKNKFRSVKMNAKRLRIPSKVRRSIRGNYGDTSGRLCEKVRESSPDGNPQLIHAIDGARTKRRDTLSRVQIRIADSDADSGSTRARKYKRARIKKGSGGKLEIGVTTFRPRYANRARGNAPTIIPGTRATKPSSVEKRAARRQKVRAYGGADGDDSGDGGGSDDGGGGDDGGGSGGGAGGGGCDGSDGKKSRTANVVKIRGAPPIGRIVSTRRTIPSLLERLTHFRANWAALLDFSNCIFNRRCRCRREDKNCLSSGASFARTYTAPSSPFRSTALRVLFSGVRGYGSPPAAVAADEGMFFRSAKCNRRRRGQSTVVCRASLRPQVLPW